MILIIEDDERTAAGLSELLTPTYDIAFAANFPAAHNFLSANEPELLIVDYDLRPENGIRVYQRLKIDFPRIKTIFLSSLNDIPLAVEAVKAGAVDFIRKPIEPQSFLTAIKKALSFKEEESPTLEFWARVGKESWLAGQSPVLNEFLENLLGAIQAHDNMLLLAETGINPKKVLSLLEREGQKTTLINLADFKGAENEEAFWITLREMLTISGLVFFTGFETLQSHFRRSLVQFIRSKNKHWQLVFFIYEEKIPREEVEQEFGAYRKIKIPLLRERKEDLVAIIDAQVAQLSANLGKPVRSVSLRTLKLLQWHPFLGNYEELESWLVASMLSSADNELDLMDLPLSPALIGRYLANETGRRKDWKLEKALKDFRAQFETVINAASAEEREKISQLMNYKSSEPS